MIQHYCDLQWHDDQLVAADYLITARTADDRPIDMRRFAACRVHVEAALRAMLAQFPTVTVAEVNRGGVS